MDLERIVIDLTATVDGLTRAVKALAELLAMHAANHTAGCDADCAAFNAADFRRVAAQLR